MSSHKINIDVSLNGGPQAAANLQKIIDKAREAGNVRVTKLFDEKGVFTGAQITQAVKGVGEAAAAAKPHTNALIKMLGRAAMVAPIWMAIRGAMMAVQNLIKSQIKYVFELEDAMARIQIVGKGTAEQYDNLKYSLVGLSIAYGVSSSEALKAAVIFAQQGKTVAETFALTRIAMIGAQVLGQDVKTTVEDMTASMNAFSIPTEAAMGILDKFIAVEKNFAVTSRDLSNAVKAVGATAKQVGVSLSALSGDVAAVIEVTRKSGAEAARGLSFIYARLLTSGKPIIEQLTGISFYMKKTGESTNELTGTLRSATDILDDLAEKWKGLGNEERLQAARALGSMRQMVVLNALMENYSTSLDARVVALTSAGTAEKALAILMETSSFKAKQLAGAMNSLILSIANTSGWKVMLDGLSQIILGFSTLIDFEKGYRAILAMETSKILANIEARNSQISGVKELIALQSKLELKPPTPENLQRIDLIKTALADAKKEFPKLQVAIETSPEVLDNFVAKIQDQLLVSTITAQVDLEYLPKLDKLEEMKEDIKKRPIEFAILPGELLTSIVSPPLSKEKQIAELDKQRVAVLKEQSTELAKQIAAARTRVLLSGTDEEEKRLAAQEEMDILQGKLTAKEKEKFELAEQLNLAKEMGLLTDTELLRLEIEQVRNAKILYDEHGRTVKIRELEGKFVATEKKDSEILIKHELELLKIRGASSSQLFRAETALKMQLMTIDKVKNSMEYQLELEKRLTEEKMNQLQVGNNSVALMKLSQKYGVEAAKEVGKLLMEPDTYKHFAERGGSTAAKAGFDEFFKSMKENFEAQQFYGVGQWKDAYGAGEGRKIPIPERDLVTEAPRKIIILPSGMATYAPLDETSLSGVRSLAQLKAPQAETSPIITELRNGFKWLTNIPQTLEGKAAAQRDVNIQSLQVNVSTELSKDKEKQAEQMQIDIAEAIRNDPKVKQAIEERISEY